MNVDDNTFEFSKVCDPVSWDAEFPLATDVAVTKAGCRVKKFEFLCNVPAALGDPQRLVNRDGRITLMTTSGIEMIVPRGK